MIVLFVDVTDVILSNLMKTPYLASKNLAKIIKLHQFLKIKTNLRLKKLNDIFWRKNRQKNNSTKILVSKEYNFKINLKLKNSFWIRSYKYQLSHP